MLPRVALALGLLTLAASARAAALTAQQVQRRSVRWGPEPARAAPPRPCRPPPAHRLRPAVLPSHSPAGPRPPCPPSGRLHGGRVGDGERGAAVRPRVRRPAGGGGRQRHRARPPGPAGRRPGRPRRPGHQAGHPGGGPGVWCVRGAACGTLAGACQTCGRGGRAARAHASPACPSLLPARRPFPAQACLWRTARPPSPTP